MDIENGVLVNTNTPYRKRVYAVPKTVKIISENAFKSANNLNYIILPKGLTNINPRAFYGCDKLKKITIPKNVIEVGEDSFAFCYDLKSVSLPDNLEEIGNSAFYNCSLLKHVKMPKHLKKVGEATFKECRSLTSIDIPESVTEIGHSAFTSCTSLTKVKLPDDMLSVPPSLFDNCSSLKLIILPKNLETISEETFSTCKKLETITLPNTLKYINRHAFFKSGLKSIEIPDSVEFIGSESFSRCQNLKYVKLPKNLSTIEKGMFKRSPLTSITLPENLKTIEKEAFSGTSFTNFEIPNSVEEIESHVFSECEKLEHIKLPEHLKEIPNNLFEKCSNLAEIKIPEHVKSIGSLSFYNCFALNDLTIPESVTQINSRAFNRCENLKSITLPKKLDYLGSSSFEGCKSLKTITLPDNLLEISSNTFSDCTSLEKMEIPNQVESVNNYAFNNCYNLKEITLPDCTEYIGVGAFRSCSSLENINLPKNLKTISDSTFENCLNLKELIIPKGVTSIGKLAFSNCISIENIEIPDSVKVIDESAFEKCTSLKNIFIPNSVLSFKGLKSAVNDSIKYLTKVENGYILSDKPSENSYDISKIGVDFNLLGTVWEDKELLLSEQRNPFVKNFYNEFLNEYNDTTISRDFMKSHNFTFFKKFKTFDNGNFNYNTYKLLYNLGVFEPAVEIDNKKVDYAQKYATFLLDKLGKKETSIEELSSIAATMNVSGFNKDFSDFLMKDFDLLIQEEKIHPGFIAKCYNEFKEVQATNTSNRGSQRQLKATAQKFIDYFTVDKFKGVTPETVHIANAIAPYFSYQHDFDNAVKIFNEIKEKNTPTRILKTKLVDESSPFKSIELLAEKSQESHVDTLKTMTDVATSQFSFEWLEKNDPTNFYLGKLCSCCAHLEGAGYSIMRASMIHPNIQNLVIRNKKGEIVAKSTLYLHPKEKYGVFNNVEISHNVKSEDYPEIYNKYISAVKLFAERYNAEHPNEKLKQLNVGMGNNDLETELENHHKKSKKILEADYSCFGNSSYDGYNGDSRSKQVVLWKLDEENSLNPQEVEKGL